MYQCVISYTGNDTIGDAANYTSITINGETRNNNKFLGDFDSLVSDIGIVLSNISVTAVSVIVNSNNNGGSANLTNNTGEIVVYITIFYPSAVLTASIDAAVNGIPSTFNFDKIPTA